MEIWVLFFHLFFTFCLLCLKYTKKFKNSRKSEKWRKCFVSCSWMTIWLKKCVFGPFCLYIHKKGVQKFRNTVLWPIKIAKNRPFLRCCHIAAGNKQKVVEKTTPSKTFPAPDSRSSWFQRSGSRDLFFQFSTCVLKSKL